MSGYDVIVVGAGPGGSAAAATAARKGLKTLLLERAAVPGTKNMSGAVLFGKMCESIFPGMGDQYFIKDQVLCEDGSIRFMQNGGMSGAIDLVTGPLEDFWIVFRDETDKWMCEQAVAAGAELRCATARGPIMEDGVCKGVYIDGGERIEAPITIAADGTHSKFLQQVGQARKTGQVVLAFKYIYTLPPEVLRERCCVERMEDGRDHGWKYEDVVSGGIPVDWTAHTMPVPSRGIITVTMYHPIDGMINARANIHQRLQWWLQLPEQRRMLKDAVFSHANAHALVWEAWGDIPNKTYTNGLMVIGDAANMINQMDGFGADAAQLAGVYAAEVAAKAKAKGDYSEAVLAEFQELWKASFIGKNQVMPAKLAYWLMHDFGPICDVIGAGFKKALQDKTDSLPYPEFASAMMLPLLMEAPRFGNVMPVLSPMIEQATGLAKNLMGGMME